VGSRSVGPDVVSFASLEVTSLASDIAATMQRAAAFRVTLGIGTTAIGVGFSDPAVLADFRYRFGDLLVDRAPDYEFYVVDSGDGTYFWSDPANVRVWPFEKTASFVTSFFADSAVMYDFFTRGRYLSLHAGVVGGERGLAAIVGSSTAGKTTTTVACARRGMKLYSDERCVLFEHLVYPFPRALTLRAGGRNLLANDGYTGAPAFTAFLQQWEAIPEVLVQPSALFSGRVGGPPLPLSAVLVIDGVAAHPQLTEVPVYDIVPHLAEAMWANASGLDRVARILAEFGALRCYKVRLGAPDQTARLIEELVS